MPKQNHNSRSGNEDHTAKERKAAGAVRGKSGSQRR
jgi:hypothetical protein